VDGTESVTGEAAELERIWLGLRTRDGLSVETLAAAQRTLAGAWQEDGHAVIADGRLRLTTRGWLLLDRLTVELAST
jgi:coproporphyrinogen III oxidase-like Fe-S oxidoreductase